MVIKSKQKKDSKKKPIEGAEKPAPAKIPHELVPKLRVDSELRRLLARPLTKKYVDTIYAVVNFIAIRYLMEMANHTSSSFDQRNTWLKKMGRAEKVRVDIGVLSDLYTGLSPSSEKRLEEIEGLLRQQIDEIGWIRTVEELNNILIVGTAPEELTNTLPVEEEKE